MLNKLLILALIINLYITPLFYSYYDILPSVLKWGIDGSIIFIFFVQIALGHTKLPWGNKVFKWIFWQSISVAFIYVVSSIMNESSLYLTLTRIRYVIYPVLLFMIFQNFLDNNYKNIGFFDALFKWLMYIQIVLVPIQLGLYLFFPGSHRFFYEEYSFVDSGTGTFGRGNGTLGVFVVLYFLYQKILRNNDVAYFFAIPLVFIFSGGANAFFIMSIVMLFFFGSKYVQVVKINFKSIIAIFFFVLSGVFFSMYVLEKNVFVEAFFKLEYAYNSAFGDEDQRVIVDSQGKVRRFSGITFINSSFENNVEFFIGKGGDAFSQSEALGISSSDVKVNRIKGGFLLKLLESGYLGVFIYYFFGFLISMHFFLRLRKHRMYLLGFMISVIFFGSTFYTRSFNSPQLITFFTFIMVIATHYSKNQNTIDKSA